MPELAQKFWCIENCVNVTEVREKSKEFQNDILKEEGKVNLVTVARLQNISKALDRAVRIASRLKKSGYNFKWFFVGNGEDYDRMQELIAENDVKDCMILLGHKDNPYPYMANADLFVLQSYYEGKPMVVDEAMIVGTPVLVSNYAAAKEQVTEGCGWVAENNEEAIYKKLKELIDNRDKLISCKENLVELDVNRFMDCSAYVNMLDEVLNNDCENI
jgi:glycosyltransferase involved in cell wall biosynthesis